MPKMTTLEELMVEDLKDLLDAENQLSRALPKMAKASTEPKLQEAFDSHLQETEGHVERLERIFQMLGKSPKGKVCQGMKGLLEEGSQMLKGAEKGATRDAAMISAAQRVEHYEMAGYGTVAAYARLLRQGEAASLLEQTLDEEKAADDKLGEIAISVNERAKVAA